MDWLQTNYLWEVLLCVTILSCLPPKANEKESITDAKANDSEISHNGIYSLEKLAEKYEPSSIDLSVDMDNYLPNFDLSQEVHNSNKDSIINRIVHIFLLKQYKYHLQKSNQGYDLLMMRKGKAKIIIDRFAQVNSIELNLEFLNSSTPYTLINKNNLYSRDPLIVELIEQIKFEQERILKGH